MAVVVTGVNDVIDLVPPRRAVRTAKRWPTGCSPSAASRTSSSRRCRRCIASRCCREPLRRVMGDDARRHDEAMARWAATRRDVSHAAFDFDLSADAMASDGFHPGEPVYRACGEALAAHIAGLP